MLVMIVSGGRSEHEPTDGVRYRIEFHFFLVVEYCLPLSLHSIAPTFELRWHISLMSLMSVAPRRSKTSESF